MVLPLGARRYCGRKCQVAAWPKHKPLCQALAAMGGASASAAAAGSGRFEEVADGP